MSNTGCDKLFCLIAAAVSSCVVEIAANLNQSPLCVFVAFCDIQMRGLVVISSSV